MKTMPRRRSDQPPKEPRPDRIAAHLTGLSAESRAAAYLIAKGYRIIARRFRSPVGEVDIVARRRDVLVFVEVKARSADAWVPGFFAVDRRKKRALRRAIHAYLTQLRVRPRTFRFDVAEVAFGGNTPPQVLHFQNVPLFPKGYHVLR